ncbi:unnamed protein product [Amoebophrya sp. A25]|nr:unnamed protein product [Amoebophrya sp. A25]|eukprot:GSA25T00012097001.1
MVKLNLKNVFGKLATERRRAQSAAESRNSGFREEPLSATVNTAEGSTCSPSLNRKRPKHADEDEAEQESIVGNTSEEKTASPQESNNVAVGDIVFVHMLQKKPQFNRHVGRVLSYMHDSGRFGVQLHDAGDGGGRDSDREAEGPLEQYAMEAGERGPSERGLSLAPRSNVVCGKRLADFFGDFGRTSEESTTRRAQQPAQPGSSPLIAVRPQNLTVLRHFCCREPDEGASTASACSSDPSTDNSFQNGLSSSKIKEVSALGRSKSMISIVKEEVAVGDTDVVAERGVGEAIGGSEGAEAEDTSKGASSTKHEQGEPTRFPRVCWKSGHVTGTQSFAFQRQRLASLFGENLATLIDCPTIGDCVASFAQVARILGRKLEEPLALQVASFLLIKRAGAQRDERAIAVRTKDEENFSSCGLGAGSQDQLKTSKTRGATDPLREYQEDDIYGVNRRHARKMGQKSRYSQHDRLFSHASSSEIYVHTNSHRGDYPLEEVLTNSDARWFISGGPLRRTGPVKLSFEFIDRNDLKTYTGWRRCRMLAIRIPPLPFGPLSVRKFYLQAACATQDGIVNFEPPRSSASAAAGFSVSPRRATGIQACTSVVAGFSSRRAVGIQADQEEEEAAPRSADQQGHGRMCDLLPTGSLGQPLCTWHRIPHNKTEYFSTIDVPCTQYFVIDPPVDACKMQVVMISNAADDDSTSVGLYYAGFA